MDIDAVSQVPQWEMEDGRWAMHVHEPGSVREGVQSLFSEEGKEMTKYCKEHVLEGTEWEDATWGRCSVCGQKGGVVVVEEVALEAELTEQTEAVEDAVEEAVEAIIFNVAEEEKEPDKVALEAEPKGIDEELAEVEDMIQAEAKEAEEARKAKIAALEAQLAELEKTEK